MNISFWLPFCVLLMVISLFFSKVPSRVIFLLGAFAWSMFISARGTFGPDTILYSGPISFESGLGLWIVYLSDFAQLLNINIVILHALIYFSVASLVTLLPNKLYRSLVIGWCFYLALGGFLSDTSTIRWSFCYLTAISAFFVLVKFQFYNPKTSLVFMSLVIILIGLLGYPGSVLLFFPQLLYEALAFITAGKLATQARSNLFNCVLIVASIAMITLIIILATSVIQRYFFDTVIFEGFVAFDLSLPKISAAFFCSFLITIYSRKLIMVTCGKQTTGGLLGDLLLGAVLFSLFLSSSSNRLSPICVSMLLIFNNLKCYNPTIVAQPNLFVLPNTYKYLLFSLVFASYMYSSNYVMQSFGFPHNIGLHLFP